MANWHYGYSYLVSMYTNSSTHPTQMYEPHTPVNYGVQTPYYEYGSKVLWDSYEANVYPNQHDSAASYILETEYVNNFLEELDKLKDEVRRYKEAEKAHLAELAQEIEDMKNKVREYEELKAWEEANTVTWQEEKTEEPQTCQPPYVPKLSFPQRAMLCDNCL